VKIFVKRILSVIIIVIFISPSTSYATSSLNIESYYQADTPASYQQLKAQVSYFQDAIDELGATSPLQVANLWAKAEKTRNGVYQYAVACNKLKEEIIKKLGKADESFWNIGVSSPWLSKYEIVKNTRIDNSTYEIILKYYWTTSTGDMKPTFNTLKIIKNNSYWCVKDVKES